MPGDDEAEATSDSMVLSVLPDIELKLEATQLTWAEGCSGDAEAHAGGILGRYQITEPRDHVLMLKEAGGETSVGASSRKSSGVDEEEFRLYGDLSPLSLVTVPQEARHAAGIPSAAHYYAFVYPLAAEYTVQLKTLNLANEPWAFLLLLGGFTYLDEAKNVLATNALALIPSETCLEMAGPYLPSTKPLNEMVKQKRMSPITLEALQDAGFASFGWVHPSERVRHGTQTMPRAHHPPPPRPITHHHHHHPSPTVTRLLSPTPPLPTHTAWVWTRVSGLTTCLTPAYSSTASSSVRSLAMSTAPSYMRCRDATQCSMRSTQ